ncbi:uncharacterized protein LOC122503046 [Leptopilina heterotoma]|uniref:uncharacterized protein LOC122503046 n=1 Tax=Leptopilina heterotoma TaxID=63436 RepID=UPI001CA8FADA|nr:uncharacterized protein LOC122503046 [Leptopilina heterotoma]
MSSNQMRKLTTFVRSQTGRKSVPTNYHCHISEKINSLKEIYKSSNTFEFETSKTKEKRPVIWADASELVEAAIESRNLIGHYKLKVMADGGQGFFKICISIIPENYKSIIDADCSSEDDNYEPKEKIFKSKCEKVNVKSEAKLTSVKKLLMLCIVPDIKESYENLKTLFEITGINKIPFKFVADFKLMLIVNGLQTASATYPCPYCFIKLKESKKSCAEDDVIVSAEGDFAKLRTYGDIRKDYETFVKLKKNKKKAPESYSNINEPLFYDEEDDKFVVDKCVVPELHLLQGFVNHLFFDGLVPLLTSKVAFLWPEKLSLSSKNYHGRVFEGNACRKLLKSADLLDDKIIYENVGRLRLLPYINAFKAMDKVVSSCFSVKKIRKDLDKNIREFKTIYEATECSTTLKIHVISKHLQDCLRFLDGDGLGIWSEQAGTQDQRSRRGLSTATKVASRLPGGEKGLKKGGHCYSQNCSGGGVKPDLGGRARGRKPPTPFPTCLSGYRIPENVVSEVRTARTPGERLPKSRLGLRVYP